MVWKSEVRRMSQQEEKKDSWSGKKVDAEWKKQVEDERRRLAAQEKVQGGRGTGARGPAGEPGAPSKPSFAQFLSGLATQALMSLGELENPMTRRREVDLAQAQQTIDLLELLQEKTKGNLTPQEENFLTNVLHDLRLRYVRAVSGSGG
jgi:predicted alpha/beta-hydrolase family hydrolase